MSAPGSPADSHEVLAHVGFVMLVPPPLQPLVRALFRPEGFGAGEVIIHEGDPSDAVYVVAAGEVEVVRNAGPGEVALDRFDRGTVFGEVGLLSRTERMATVRAVDRVEVLRLGRDGFEALLAVHPEVADALAGQVRLSRINTLLRGHPAFSLLPVEVLVASLAGFEPLELEPGGRIVDDGADDALYLVESGRLRMVSDRRDTAAEVGELGPGDFFGEDAVLHGTERVEAVEAVEASRLFRLDVATFSELVQHDAAFAEAMLDRARRRGQVAAPEAAVTAPRHRIEIDQQRREQATAEITQSEFFQSLTARADSLRSRLRGSVDGRHHAAIESATDRRT